MISSRITSGSLGRSHWPILRCSLASASPPRLASAALRWRLDVYPLAQRVWRAGSNPGAANHLPGGTRPREGAAHGQLSGYRAGGADPDAVGNPGAEAALYPQDSPG